jgi:hypothetical protein
MITIFYGSHSRTQDTTVSMLGLTAGIIIAGFAARYLFRKIETGLKHLDRLITEIYMVQTE